VQQRLRPEAADQTLQLVPPLPQRPGHEVLTGELEKIEGNEGNRTSGRRLPGAATSHGQPVLEGTEIEPSLDEGDDLPIQDGAGLQPWAQLQKLRVVGAQLVSPPRQESRSAVG
jgi:hypothetical protein